jgi:two-component system sensor histidine kinase KdpD
MAIAIVQHISNGMNAQAALLKRRGDEEFEIAASAPSVAQLGAASLAAAEWSWTNHRRAGWRTDTLPEAEWLFVPLEVKGEMLGLLALRREKDEIGLSEPERKMLDTLTDQAALILERGKMIAEMAEAQRFTETERLRSALLSSVSHDLRTPLVSILGAATTLTDLDEKLSPSARKDLLGAIVGQARRLHAFVQNLLDMTRIGYGAITVRKEWLDLEDIIEAAKEQLRARLVPRSDHGMRPVHLRIEDGAGVIYSDEALLLQVLVNLIENAAKYSPPGSPVEIDAERQSGSVRIRVIDHGPGVPKDKTERIFDPFFRADSRDTSTEGSGLGLVIVRGFVEAMGGTVRAFNRRDGAGAVFEIRLPQPKPPPRIDEAHPSP